jgi:hypothetical protein
MEVFRSTPEAEAVKSAGSRDGKSSSVQLSIQGANNWNKMSDAEKAVSIFLHKMGLVF